MKLNLEVVLAGLLWASVLGCSDGSEPEDAGEWSWAVGFFHDAEMGPGVGKSRFVMYELRSDGTGYVVGESCQGGAFGPFEFSWEALSESSIEVFHPEEETFWWISGLHGRVRVDRGAVEDTVVSYEAIPGGYNVYTRGRLCVTERPQTEDCGSSGLTVEVCGD